MLVVRVFCSFFFCPFQVLVDVFVDVEAFGEDGFEGVAALLVNLPSFFYELFVVVFLGADLLLFFGGEVVPGFFFCDAVKFVRVGCRRRRG